MMRCGRGILAGGRRKTGACWDDSAGEASACRGWRERRHTFCGCTTARRRRDIPDTRRRCTWTIHMHEDGAWNRAKNRSVDRPMTGSQYTARDFQLEVLDRLAEMQEFATALEGSWEKKLEEVKEQRLLRFDSRTLIAMLALALSIGAYVIQDARNSARQDSEIAAMQGRIQRLEQIAATTTEARIRSEVQLGELRDGQNDIKALLQAHDNSSRRGSVRK